MGTKTDFLVEGRNFQDTVITTEQLEQLTNNKEKAMEYDKELLQKKHNYSLSDDGSILLDGKPVYTQSTATQEEIEEAHNLNALAAGGSVQEATQEADTLSTQATELYDRIAMRARPTAPLIAIESVEEALNLITEILETEGLI